MSDETLTYSLDHEGIARVGLNRPERRNAFDASLIRALTDAFRRAGDDPDVRIVVLEAVGKHFSAGADLGWMRDSAQWSEAANIDDAHRLAELMATLDRLPKPTIARVQGAAFGGAVGLVCCCDIALGADNVRFCLSEARLGLAPAVISPYVIRTMGPRQARRYFLTTEEIDAPRALNLGLLHETCDEERLDGAVADICQRLLLSGPEALLACKKLVERVETADAANELEDYTAGLIARLRTGKEGQEGLSAFFEKRPPAWVPKGEH